MPLPKSELPREISAFDSSMRSALDRAAHHARAYLATLDTGAVAATASREELLSRLDVPLTPEGVAADLVADELAAAVDGGLIGSAGGRFFAWVTGRALPSAVARHHAGRRRFHRGGGGARDRRPCRRSVKATLSTTNGTHSREL
jgi:hypothetical protein